MNTYSEDVAQRLEDAAARFDPGDPHRALVMEANALILTLKAALDEHHDANPGAR